MGQREIVRGIRIEVRAVRFRALVDCRSQSGSVEHLPRDGRVLLKSIAQYRRTGHELRMIAKNTPS